MNRVSQEEIFTVEPNFNIKESIFEVLLKIVEICPENIAIADNELHISYSILLVKVRNYAFYLQKILDDTKNPVAICIPYSHRYIVSMLALNSLGRPFLPLDINTPALMYSWKN